MMIGDFARRSRLSPKALRLYDSLGLLSPSDVDQFSGYRFYRPEQLDHSIFCVCFPCAPLERHCWSGNVWTLGWRGQ
ncbi:MerR family DNA-binding transcriptional regulator [Actinokineospora sp.]|uniref:MerR family DNA-binding transcriptional regulator n=1 Tax=Actinokineospora sp. TaxID=1872133 RepID=UPI003D6A9EC9